MGNLKETYKQLTGINIDEQSRTWDERGKGYYGEYKVFKELLYALPGEFKVLMNVELPIFNKKTEIDMLIIHEVGLFVIEIKYYKGRIYGKSEENMWTQFFVTVSNQKLKNPIKQNDYHIKALKEHKINLPIYSVIIFANNECELNIKNERNDIILANLKDAVRLLIEKIKHTEKRYTIQDIDETFNKLKGFSHITESKDNYMDFEPMQVEEFFIKLREDYNNKVLDLDNKLIELKKQYFKKFLIACGIAMVFLFYFFNLNVSTYRAEKELAMAEKNQALQQLEAMERNFTRITDYSDVEIQLDKDSFSVVNFQLNKSKDIQNTYQLTFGIKNNCDYTLQLEENTEAVVKTKNGKVTAYPMYNKEYRLSSFMRRITKNQERMFRQMELFNISDEVDYIKLVNIKLVKYESYKYIPIIENFEIELYKNSEEKL